MKDFKNDSTSVLTRFGRDKRQRTVTATAERVERRPRLQRDAADSEQPSDDRKPVKRASYNPHFTEDNRPAFDKPRRSFGDERQGDRARSDERYRDGDKPRRSFGDKPRGEKPAYGDNRGPKKFGDRKFGDKPYGERKSGDKPAGDRRFADKKSGDRRFGDKPYKPGFRKHDDKPASYPKFTPEKQIGEMRLNRFLAQSGLCSRREADDFITAGDVSAYIPTNVISITDGQIFLETELFHSGVMPAVNPGISVSRVGGNAQIKAMKKVAGTLKLIYSQYRELQSFAQFGSDLDADTKARLAQGERIVEVLKQNRSAPVPVEKQVAILYATIHDLLVKVKVADVAEYEKGLYEYLENDAAGAAVMETIRTTGNLDKDTEEALKGVLSAYTESFVKAH